MINCRTGSSRLDYFTSLSIHESGMNQEDLMNNTIRLGPGKFFSIINRSGLTLYLLPSA